MDIILASNSAIRASILRNAGLTFTSLNPGYDEAKTKLAMQNEGPEAIAIKLAENKALAVSSKHPHVLVIGCDQTLGLAGKTFDKPTSISEARHHLTQLRSQTHQLHSAISCAKAGTLVWSYCGHASLTMRNFSDDFLDTYMESIATSYSTSVGGYKLEENGITLFEKIEGDYFTILGLPLLPLLAFLRREKYIPS